MKIEPTKLNKLSIKTLPQREDKVSTYESIFLVPSGLKHDSGYMMIAIVGVMDSGDMEVCAYPDDIGWDFRELEQKYGCTGMRTDCYYPNGVLRFWGNDVRFIVGEAFSSTDIIVKKITK